MKDDTGNPGPGPQPPAIPPGGMQRAIEGARTAGTRAAMVARTAAGRVGNAAGHGVQTARSRFIAAGGWDGVTSKAKRFAAQVSASFVPDAGTTGFKRITTRFRNLWINGSAGKVAVVSAGLVLFIIAAALSGGAESSGFSGISHRHGVVIKGLYAGMPVNEARRTLAGLLDDNWTVTPLAQDAVTGGWAVHAHWEASLTPDISLRAGEDRRVYEIRLGAFAINPLFNAESLSGDAFAQAIADNHGIPLTAPDIKPTNPLDILLLQGGRVLDVQPALEWRYRDSRGGLLVISENKTLVLSRETAAATQPH